ncbi:DNA-directed RNA polymerase II subunit rpb1 [Allomyces javanicus]|nr:DNA-directed RNA polymerase II subunit rpb1 [Allomyces javanicus]
MHFMLGFDKNKTRPEWMVLTTILVPPHCIRPSISMGSGGRGEDDLTYKLCDILRFNKLIKKSDEENTQRCIDEYEQLLQYHVSTYFDNETSFYAKSCQKGGRPLKSISSRISGKEGRIRGNLMGKRVDFTARTVITGDPTLGVEEIGVPLEIAMNLTFPEMVNRFNIDRLQDMVNRGAKQYPGAKYVTVKDKGNKYDLAFRKRPTILQIGDTVERHLLNGDYSMYNLLMKLPNWDGRVPTPCIIKPKPMWSGKQIISMLFPTLLNYSGYNMSHTEENDQDPLVDHDTKVLIEDGQLLHGSLCKKSVGAAQGGLVHIIWKDYGPDKCATFLNGCQYVVNEWLFHHGFTVGIGDCLVSEDTKTTIANIIKDARETVSSNKNLTSTQAIMELANARDNSGKVAAASLSMDNNFKQMVYSGSKGSVINIAQITACVGQQNVEGGQVPFVFRNRTLPHFEQFDNGPDARGFVGSSYISGLNPIEYFFHAMGGREGLIDTACKTSNTGYIQRRLVKAMEDISVNYDMTVRSADGKVIQFAYGEDFMDGTGIEKQSIPLAKMSDEALFKETKGCPLEEVCQLMDDRKFLREMRAHTASQLDSTFYLPVNFQRILGRRDMKSAQSMNQGEIFRLVTNCIAKLSSEGVTTPLFKVAMRWFLRSSRLGDINVEKLLDYVYRELHKSQRVRMGEFVDNIINGANETDLEHHPNNTTLGYIRNGDVKEDKAILTACLEEDVWYDRIVSIEEVASPHQFVYDFTVEDTRTFCTYSGVHCYDTFHLSGMVSSWCVRLELNRNQLVSTGKNVIDIASAIELAFDHNVVCYATHEVVGNKGPIVLVFVVDEELAKLDEDNLSMKAFLNEQLEGMLSIVDIGGIDGVSACQIRNQACFIEDEETGEMVAKTEYLIETTGINLIGASTLPGIDMSRSICNNPMEMMSVFGIEAAYQSLLTELRGVIEYGGGYVNLRHLQVLCELMTNRGQLMSITRHGINRLGHGFLKKATFEETQDILMDAAVNGESDPIRGVSERIMLGRAIPVGTGSISIMEPKVTERVSAAPHGYNPLAPRYLQICT